MKDRKARTDLTTRDFIEQHAVFTTTEFRAALPADTPASTVLNRLRQAHERGYIERVRHGVYASRVGAFAAATPDPLLVASRLASDYTIAYHSALEAHGVAHAPFRRVTLLSTRTPFMFEYRGYEFVVRRPPKRLLDDDAWKNLVVPLRRGNELVKVTSRERTLVDCLDNLKWAGGIEEVLRSIGGFPSLDIESAIAYVDMLGSASIAARLGWVLSAAPDLWRMTVEEIGALRSRVGKGPYFLDTRANSTQLIPEWRLYIPEGIDPAEELRG
jgi:predicted transcriptional regulator of viral defense system